MTGARGHWDIVYCLNSGSDDTQTSRHNGKGRAGTPLTTGEACFKRIMSSFLMLKEGDNRNRWRDGQVCPDVGQGIMVPWVRRPVRPGGRERSPALDGEKGKSSALDERRALVGTDWKRALNKRS
ncbi:hypothetical protein TNCV_1783371 [Trichonephila clavipes]|nr:hypothetical protein TNCV_1783371 [Trichonephila clavipes]